MTKYVRIIDHGAYKDITTVDDTGVYTLISQWPDGVITSFYKTTIQAMGHVSTEEFLAKRTGFTPC